MSARIRGGFVGVTTVTLAVAAHGAAGGTLPSEATALLLLGLAALLALLVATVPALARRTGVVPAALVVGQVVTHLVLAADPAHHMHPGAAQPGVPMLAAHAGAVLVCAAAIAAAERVGPAVSAAVRAVIAILRTWTPRTEPVARPAPPVDVRPHADVLCRTCAPRRGPPVLA